MSLAMTSSLVVRLDARQGSGRPLALESGSMKHEVDCRLDLG